jgi:putative ABC transport system permease protein
MRLSRFSRFSRFSGFSGFSGFAGFSGVRRWVLRLVNAIRPSRAEPDLAREIDAHLALVEDDLVRRGMTAAEARAAARRAFDGIEQTKERHRDARSFVWLDDARRDLQYAGRMLRRSPAFTTVAVLTLALGIGANTAIFSVLHAVLLQPLPYNEPARLVRLYENVPAAESPTKRPVRIGALDTRELLELRATARSLSHVVTYSRSIVTMLGAGDSTQITGSSVSAGTLSMLGVKPLHGRSFSAAEDAGGGEKVVILSYEAWNRYFGGDRQVLGRRLIFTGNTTFTGGMTFGASYTVIGIMPRGFHFPDDSAMFWTPLAVTLPADNRPHRTIFMAQLADGVSVEQGQSEIASILLASRGQTTPTAAAAAGRSRFELTRVADDVTKDVESPLLVLAAAVGLVLLIACANVANLLLARTAARRREIAVRAALGAGRGRLVRQVLTESVLLSMSGGIAGSALAFAAIAFFRALATTMPRIDLGSATALPRLDAIVVNASVLLFATAISAATGVLFGLAPAIRHSRANQMDALRDATGAGSGFARRRGHVAQGGLMVAEIAMATMLMVGGALLTRSFVRLAMVDPGFDPAGVLTFQVSLRGDKHPADGQKTFADDLIGRLQSIPAVEAAAYARQLPMVQLEDRFVVRTTPGRGQLSDFSALPWADARFVSPHYLDALGIRIVEGRGLSDADPAERTLVVNRTFAHRYFPDESPVGRIVYAGAAGAAWRIVGVVDDQRLLGLDREPVPAFFADITHWSGPNRFPVGPYYAVRTRENPEALVPLVRDLVRQMDGEAPMYNVSTLEQIVSNSITLPRLYAVLLAIFAAIAAGLAAIGIYGVIGYSVTQRTREIGVRMALGARRAQVIGLVLGEGFVWTAAGIALGLAGAAALSRYLASLLFGVTPLDAPTFAAVAAAFAAVATMAAYVPARRAATVDPSIALRCE